MQKKPMRFVVESIVLDNCFYKRLVDKNHTEDPECVTYFDIRSTAHIDYMHKFLLKLKVCDEEYIDFFWYTAGCFYFDIKKTNTHVWPAYEPMS